MEKIKVIENAKVVLERGIIWDGVIVISGERIAAFGKRAEVDIPDGAEHIDANGAYVGPGFVDIHVHGGGGYSTCYNPVEASEFFLKTGTTTLLATPDYHMNLEELLNVIRIIKENMGKARTIRGIYMEAPYTNPDFGSHSYANPWRQGVIEEEYRQFVDAGGELVKVWTVAAERKDLVPFLQYARKVNPDVRFAVGHSNATPAEIRALGTKYRPTIETHSMNATHTQPVPGGTRGYGPDEYCFKDEDVFLRAYFRLSRCSR